MTIVVTAERIKEEVIMVYRTITRKECGWGCGKMNKVRKEKKGIVHAI